MYLSVQLLLSTYMVGQLQGMELPTVDLSSQLNSSNNRQACSEAQRPTFQVILDLLSLALTITNLKEVAC